jgi:hypothetical protein
MITDFFLNLWTTVTNWMISILPSGTDPFTQGAGASLSMFSTMNYFLPMGELFAVLVSVLVLGGPMLIASGIIWFTVGVLRGGSPKS